MENCDPYGCLLRLYSHIDESTLLDSSNNPNFLYMRIQRYRKITSYDTFVVFEIFIWTKRPEYLGSHFLVERRYSEFEWLRSKLVESHPASFVPPLPGKVITVEPFAESHLSVRSSRLQTFLVRLIRHPILSSDPNLIAFSTLPTKEFSEYRRKNGILPALLPAMFSKNISLAAPSTLGPDLSDCLIESNLVGLCENEFLSFHDEVDTFARVAQRLARCTEFISNQLESLGSQFTVMARCLDSWPPGLAVNVGDRQMSDIATLKNSLNEHTAVVQPSLDWCQDRPTPAVISKASGMVAKETADLAERLRSDTLPNWWDASSYCQAVRTTLKSRDDLEKRYLAAMEKAKNESSKPVLREESHLAVIARTYFSWNKCPLSELISNANKLQDELTFTNEQIRAEFTFWQNERRTEITQTLLKMSEHYNRYWSAVANGWRNAFMTLDEMSSDYCANSTADKQFSMDKSQASSSSCTGCDNSFPYTF